ncbi:hypothetical protein BC828DRAFT_386552 [Blastocladiella britannica]|nr:hypothetical protein BC828DRAFT_386552 [Blastocladiella britannica]
MTMNGPSLDHGDIAVRVLVYAAAMARYMDDALSILFVQAHDALDPDRDLVAAMLSRGFPDLRPSRAVAHGHAYLLPHYPTPFLLDATRPVFSRLSANADLHWLEWFWKWSVQHGNSPQRVFATGINLSSPAVLEWYQAKVALTNIIARRTEGRVPTFQKLCLVVRSQDLVAATVIYDELVQSGGNNTIGEDGNPQLLQSRLFLTVIEDATLLKHTSVLDWWWTRVNATHWTYTAMASKALISGDILVIEWWWARYLALRQPHHEFATESAIKEAATNSGPTAAPVLWLWEKSRSFPFEFAWCDWDREFSKGKLPDMYTPPELALVDWWYMKLAERGIRLTITAQQTKKCAHHGKLEVLDWIWNHRKVTDVEWSEGMTREAFWSCNLLILDWISTRWTDIPIPKELSDWDVDRTKTPEERLAVYQWWETHVGFPTEALSSMGTLVVQQFYPPLVEWWLGQMSNAMMDDSKVTAALRLAINGAGSPAALDVLAQYAEQRGIEFAPLRQSLFRALTQVERAWWDAFESSCGRRSG